ncbi:MAG: hypothetical protein M0P91_02555 [Sulfuricurvum sp.]|jgi:predicted Fe-Mo cluster-binding NifX family protein|uniref:hypothetical protein n=1 Tax=Sulfuricurvum sp. TaxID=2025608 RepID=UPI0025D6042A|nr:hypothetical protein [Sulfuricurvum sp.]MCK9372052.1 hypothetical protein [Sulfuricurvum sp.]
MIVAIPMDARERVYHKNPCSATFFALYEVNGDRHHVHYRFLETKLNPWEKWEGEMVRDPDMKACQCSNEKKEDPQHISEHYTLLKALGKTDYLLADLYCLNTLYTMRDVGIKIYKLPPFIKNGDEAIHHFIIGSGIADDLRRIHLTAPSPTARLQER